ncbi:autotransporter-associated beta strand repeat-containing protein [Phyllobacterium zundukense]|uniref:autotransporter-associated beta strand repeat-containing protein n=1 Tax=Phyllobacterium zundukense TaxID=1867719 RepID=UPI0012FFE923|nr:autotransporter-associated beta strand repeat-containing protein [Phyllobacterium zundukense]
MAEKLHPSTGGFTVLSQYIAEFLKDPSKLGPSSTLITNSQGLAEIATTYGNDVITNAEENKIAPAASSTPVTSDGAITLNLDKPVATVQTPKPGTVVVYEDGKYTFDKKISGNVSLVKTGLGGLILSGDNDYTGDTHIAQGQLAVRGSVQNLTVDKDSAIVQTQADGGWNVRGDATFIPGSQLQIIAKPDGTLNPLKINGKLAITGSTLFHIHAADETIPTREGQIALFTQDHTIIRASKGWRLFNSAVVNEARISGPFLVMPINSKPYLRTLAYAYPSDGSLVITMKKNN